MKRILSVLSVCLLFCCSARGEDWAHWRGPAQDGASADTGLPATFDINPKAQKNVIWRQPFGCRSTPVILNNRVYIINGVGAGLSEGERVMCFDANDGRVLWENKFHVFHCDIVSSRVGWTNPVGDAETGNIYVHGTQGFLRCYDKDGKILWNHSLTEEYGRVSGYGGRSASPVVDSGLVIVGMINGSWGDYARGANRFVAFDKLTGTPVWWSELPGQMKGTYYSTPVVTTIGGQRLLITGGADGAVHALQVRTGKLVWSYKFANGVVNSSPVTDGKYVYISNGEENDDPALQGGLICVDAEEVKDGQPKLVWEVNGIKFGYSSPVLADGKIYIASDSARMYCYDAKTGKPVGRAFPYGRLARGSPVWGDGKLYVFDVNGHFHILQPDKRGALAELHDQGFREKNGRGFVETNGTPAIANGKLYFGTLEEFYCIGTPEGKALVPPIPHEPEKGDGKAAQLLIYPADVVLHPGENADFQIRAFDSSGVPVKDVPQGEWSIPTPPKQPNGRQPPALAAELASPQPSQAQLKVKEMPGQQGYVEFKSGNMTARARVRVAPALPYKQDFTKVPVGATPGGWVNTMGRYAVVDLDGKHVLKKLSENAAPPVAKARAYIGLPTDKDYIIQADVMGKMVNNYMPDVGLINDRYRFVLDGKIDPDDGKRRVKIASWEGRRRIEQPVVFDWKPDTWYTMKMAVELTGKTAKIKGKVWERGKEEPKEWTKEFEDPFPMRDGSPGIYAYAAGSLQGELAEGYFDNVIVSLNEKK
ncbi:MAG TPA: PQQ-binding-like beta-propeller repeat protein [Gemmataceae bacterium]|jgi:outer membrane protein assembly factor BamB|nr:PQQ-binding-like beta-propeller repeat protein [Gemmataceae bacterium]